MMSPLGNASAEDCANYVVMMFSDYAKAVTMQNLYHDGGFYRSCTRNYGQSIIQLFIEYKASIIDRGFLSIPFLSIMVFLHLFSNINKSIWKEAYYYAKRIKMKLKL